MTSEPQNITLGSPALLAHEIAPDIEKAILRFVVDGFERWKAEGLGSYDNLENHYTVRLVACMKKIKAEHDMPYMVRYQPVEPSDDMWEGQEDPAHARSPDIEILWDLFNDDAYLSIECKRLAPGNLARLYVVKGINRFVQGFYGAKSQSGAMIGYVVQGTPAESLERVNHHVSRNWDLGLEQMLVTTDPIGWLSTVFASLHSRPSTPLPIRLTHFFFDMGEDGA